MSIDVDFTSVCVQQAQEQAAALPRVSNSGLNRAFCWQLSDFVVALVRTGTVHKLIVRIS